MDPISRRQLLSGAAAATAIGLVPRSARACGWADEPRVLEVFLKGGFSPWNSFWYDPALAAAEGAPNWATFSGSAATPPLTVASGLPSGYLGPAALPLAYCSLSSKLRVVVTKHDLEPHEAAVPYALTGTRLGRPQLKGLAAAVNHFWYVDTPPVGYAENHPLHSWVLDCGNAEAARWAAETGDAGKQFRPPVLRLSDPDLVTRLQRPVSVTKFDAVERHLAGQYRGKLLPPGASPGSEVRSRGFDAYEAGLAMVHDYSDEIYALLSSPAIGFTPGAPATPTISDNLTRRGLTLAARLLQYSNKINYCCVIDAGLHRTYDTHDGFGSSPATTQAENLWSLLTALSDLDLAGELDGTLVVLTSEFGRKQLAAGTDGTEHWPWGYVSVLMGAPYTTTSCRGSIDSAGYAEPDISGAGPYEPQDIRAALASYLFVTPDDAVDTSLLTHTLTDLQEDILLGDAC